MRLYHLSMLKNKTKQKSNRCIARRGASKTFFKVSKSQDRLKLLENDNRGIFDQISLQTDPQRNMMLNTVAILKKFPVIIFNAPLNPSILKHNRVCLAKNESTGASPATQLIFDRKSSFKNFKSQNRLKLL